MRQVTLSLEPIRLDHDLVPAPEPPDRGQSGLLRDARMKLSSRDQEAMRKIRLTMFDGPMPSGEESHDRAVASNGTSKGPPGTAPYRSERPSEDDELRGVGPSQVGPVSPIDSTIAVIGHDRVGKSTLIRRALKTWGMSHPVTSMVQGHEGERVFLL